MSNDQLTTAVIAIMVFLFGGFLLFITRTPAGDLSVAAVALVGPLVGAVVASYFHTQATAAGANISATGAAQGAAAASGQSTSVQTPRGSVVATIGQPASPTP
jgi:hypothetical protein